MTTTAAATQSKVASKVKGSVDKSSNINGNSIQEGNNQSPPVKAATSSAHPSAASTSTATTSKKSTSTPASLHTSPRMSASIDLSAAASTNGDTMNRITQQASSPRLPQAASFGMATSVSSSGSNSNTNHNGPPTHAGHHARLRASTSQLPAMAYPNTSHPALLGSIPVSAHIAAQAATASIIAANVAASAHHYRTMNCPSSSSPSSAQFPIHNPFLIQHQLQQSAAYEKHTAELTNSIIAFLSPILPTEEEYRIKEATRRQLERLAGRVSPGAKLLAFGSMANGFALRNSDMDLCCLIAGVENESLQKAPAPSASELVETLAKLIREETDYTVMPLPKARIPIIKISRSPTADVPYDISCDIGFENRLALENTRLLLTYAMVDPPRLRTLVLFLKVWTKRRKLNSPYTGTLSSYGYTLLMIFFLSHVKRPVVLPNLQQIPPSATSTRSANVTLNGNNIYFYDDVATLRKEWSSSNTENVGELLIDFFRYFSKEYVYSKDVISIRTEGGLLSKDGNVWSSELCIEDPFQSGYNVARTVTRDGLYTIRGEFMRASRILTSRSDRGSHVIDELCEEREDGLTRAPDAPYHHHRQRASFAAPSTAYNQAHPASYDARYLRDVARRFDLNSNTTNGFGGSFAFEEMARGLGQAQKSNNVMAYPPTTAMLAPLSQNTGLSPRQSLMRAGLRYDTPRRGQSGSPMNVNFGNLVGSSTRSEDGSTNYEKKKSEKGSAGSTISAQTSPNLDNAIPTFSSAVRDGALGDALRYGSEISFGSQRFQLHPQTSSSSSSSQSIKASRTKEDTSRTQRSFSDGLNRSLSLPRSSAETNEMRRSSTPLLSEPSSPNKLHGLNALPNQVQYLEPAMANLNLLNGHHSSRSSLSDSGAGKRVIVNLPSSQPLQAQTSQISSSSPFLPPSPWSSAGQDHHSRDSHVALTPEEEGSFGLDDEPVSLSDVDENTRLDSPRDQNQVCSVDVDALSQGKEHAIRSWAAASQSAELHGQPASATTNNAI